MQERNAGNATTHETTPPDSARGVAEARGQFVWHELMTSDPEAAKAFYSGVTGWATAPFEPSPEPYTMWMLGQTPVGGVMQLPGDLKAQGVPQHWLTSIGTADIDTALRDLTDMKGSIMMPATDMPDVGRFAVAADPAGAVFTILQPATVMPPADTSAHGQFSWHELLTTDIRMAFDFYSRIFGWEKMDEHDMGALGIYLLFGWGGQQMGGMFNKTPEMPMPPNWLPYVKVDDITVAVESVRRLGDVVMNGPMEVPGGDWIAQCTDAQGAAFAVHSTKRPV